MPEEADPSGDDVPEEATLSSDDVSREGALSIKDVVEEVALTGDESMDYEWVDSVELFDRFNVF